MRVEILGATAEPMNLISLAAGCCYGNRDVSHVSHRRVLTCYKRKHMSVFEHASVSILVEGISRACMAQLTRHRLVSFCVESQRYCRIDVDGHDWYVMPPAFPDDAEQTVYFPGAMYDAACEYQEALASGIKPEDARYLLPEATKTNLVMTCNVRELLHLFDMRLDKSAQWEIRGLAAEIKNALKGYGEQWCALMELYESEGK